MGSDAATATPAAFRVKLGRLLERCVKGGLLVITPRLDQSLNGQQCGLEGGAVPEKPKALLCLTHLAPQRQELAQSSYTLRGLGTLCAGEWGGGRVDHSTSGRVCERSGSRDGSCHSSSQGVHDA